jgi:hypothetical protein
MILFWLSLVLYAAALASAVFHAGDDGAGGAARALLGIGATVHAGMFVCMMAGSKYPVDYELMNATCRSFFTAVILFIIMGGFKSKAPALAGLAVILWHPLIRMYTTQTLGLQDQMSHAFGIYSIVFYQFHSLAMGFLGNTFALSAGWLLTGEKGAPGALRPGGRLMTCAFWGFIAFTASQLFGSLWALNAGWGDVWVWASSHIFSAVVWIFYAGLLHVPAAPRLPRNTAAWMGIIGFSMAMFWAIYHEYAVLPAYFRLYSALPQLLSGGLWA